MEMTKEKRDTIITTLYDKCSKGEISLNQRETLIKKTRNMYAVTESAKEPEDIKPVETKNLSPKQKYDLFKESVYEKCSKGEITSEQREELLEKAREKFMEISE